jgi:hypothetical protein
MHNQSGRFSILDYLKAIGFRFGRIVPLYYTIFLVGWQLGPHFSEGPCWFTYEKGFVNCSEYWWSVFTMTINFFPEYVIANEGCYYWGWYPACDFQIFLFLPIFVYLVFKQKYACV